MQSIDEHSEAMLGTLGKNGDMMMSVDEHNDHSDATDGTELPEPSDTSSRLLSTLQSVCSTDLLFYCPSGLIVVAMRCVGRQKHVHIFSSVSTSRWKSTGVLLAASVVPNMHASRQCSSYDPHNSVVYRDMF